MDNYISHILEMEKYYKNLNKTREIHGFDSNEILKTDSYIV